MMQTILGAAFAPNALVSRSSCYRSRSFAVQRHRIARSRIVRARSKENVNGVSDKAEQDGPAQPEERFVSVSDLLAEVRASS